MMESATGRLTSESDPDAQLMLEVAEGKTQALRMLFEKWKLPLINFFYRSLQSREEAEDLTLKVFERIYRAAYKYEPRARFSTYLFQVARNLLKNEYRRRSRKPVNAVDPNDLVNTVSEESAELREHAETEEALNHALEKLPEKFRTPLLLQHQQGFSQTEIAEMLNISENSLRVTLHRARKLLKSELEQVL